LSLRAHLWVEAGVAGRVEPAPGDVVYVDATHLGAPGDVAHHYDTKLFDSQKVRIVVPPSGAELAMAEVADLVHEVAVQLGIAEPAAVRIDVDAAFAVLSGPNVHFGILKSGFQKLTRVRAAKVALPDGRIVDGRVVVMMFLAICFTSRGSGFVPDLGTYVRGQVAALKRLGVVMVEDAMPEAQTLRDAGVTASPDEVLASVLGVAQVCASANGYYANRAVVATALRVIATCVQSRHVVAFRQQGSGPLPYAVRPSERTIRADFFTLYKAARLLRTLVSFGGDMDMMDTASDMTRLSGTIATTRDPSLLPTVTVPLSHAIDQHVFRGYMHVPLEMPSLPRVDAS
jgi:hypothetical protein